jgi:hypothetical protein
MTITNVSGQSAKSTLFQAMTVAIDSNIHSILIFHQGSQDYEHYFNGFAMDSLQDVGAAFNSVTSLLVGIAVDKGFIKDVDSTAFEDTSHGAAILCRMISQASGISIMEFARRYLFDPIGISRYRWIIDSSGNNSFYVRPRDLIKLGRMIKDGGVWENHRLVSAQWLQTSTATNRYFWHNRVVRKEPVVFAMGQGGQYLMVFRNLDLIVVFTQAKGAFDLLGKYILPAYQKAPR